MEDADARARAEQLDLQAGQRYIKINAHIKVYGSRNAETEQLARNGIEFIEAALKLVPESPNYLNTYGLLVADGLGDKDFFFVCNSSRWTRGRMLKIKKSLVLSHGKQRETKNSTPEIEVMTNAVWATPIHSREQVKCFGEMSEDD
jgi:hypothetical protein